MKFLIAGIFTGLAILFIVDKFALRVTDPDDVRDNLSAASADFMVP